MATGQNYPVQSSITSLHRSGPSVLGLVFAFDPQLVNLLCVKQLIRPAGYQKKKAIAHEKHRLVQTLCMLRQVFQNSAMTDAKPTFALLLNLSKNRHLVA